VRTSCYIPCSLSMGYAAEVVVGKAQQVHAASWDSS